MSVQIMYFASLREAIGRASDQVDIDTPVSAAEIWTQATGQAQLPAQVLIAINHEYATADSLVHAGDELAFFPPVTGG